MKIKIMMIVFSMCSMLFAGGTEKTVEIYKNKVPVMAIKVDSSAIVTPIKNKTVVQTDKMYLHIWVMDKGATIKSTIPKVPDVIAMDFTGFIPQKSMDVNIGDGKARFMSGVGIEADDEDDGHAEVVVFSLNEWVFVACIHGEEQIEQEEHNAMLSALKTAVSF